MTDGNRSIPKLTIAMIAVGTRGDVQPFLALAIRLLEHGHCVRLATHSNFEGFVKSAGIDFYPLGGDPRIIVEYWTRDPSLSSHVIKDISIQREQLKAIINSVLPACTEPDPITRQLFRAQAIIANPIAFGVADVAEALGVPLHIFFTFPWLAATNEFPNPFIWLTKIFGNRLVNITVEFMFWWVMRRFINESRKNKLNLAPIGFFDTSHLSYRHFPTVYMWSNHVLPKPNEWSPQVDVVGYCYLDLGSKYEPPKELVQWLEKGSKPVYIGFGSTPVNGSERIRSMILDALKNTGQRGIIARGWGDLGTHENIPEDVFLLTDCPHDWLFPQCSAVVHHGGAGTTAAGLKAGCPTTIVPFLADQFLWGERACKIGVGPAPIPISQLRIESLSEAIIFMLQPQVKSRAMKLAECIEKEDGVGAAIEAFHRLLMAELPLPKKKMRVQIPCNGFSVGSGICAAYSVLLSFTA